MFKIYGRKTPVCSYCNAAEKHLTAKGIPYEYIDVAVDEEALAFIRSKGAKSVPQVYNGDTLIGGFDNLVEWLLEQGL